MRFLMSGGGTAGHIYPALTVADLLGASGRDEVLFAGTPGGLESSAVPEHGVRFVGVPARGFDRSRPSTLPAAVAVLGVSTLKCIRLLRSFRPDVVIGFGGYVSIPVGFAAALSGVPLVLHEQNSVPGLANRLLSRYARAVAVTYPGSASRLAHPDRAVVTGNPVRPDVLDSDRTAARRGLGIAEDETLLLVFGGSRGARHINSATLDLYSRLMMIPGLRVLHAAGRMEADSVRERLVEVAGPEHPRYRLVEYIEDMGAALAAADLVVSRAGATTIAEITAVGRASVLVPYPYATDDHQTSNAAAARDAGAAVVVADSDLDGPTYADAVVGLLGDRGARERMASAAASLGRRDAAEAVARVAKAAVGQDAWRTAADRPTTGREDR